MNRTTTARIEHFLLTAPSEELSKFLDFIERVLGEEERLRLEIWKIDNSGQESDNKWQS